MFRHHISDSRTAIGRRLERLKLAIQEEKFALNRSRQLIFLCGANRAPLTPSQRREDIRKFAEAKLPESRIVFAEGIFDEISKLGHNKNILDLEHIISSIADFVLIVLESHSAFCELGAFAHKKLRDKLVVINDSHFRTLGFPRYSGHF
jgi:hypothetical protein